VSGQTIRWPQTASGYRLAAWQGGVVGDITASRRVGVPDWSREEYERLQIAREPFPLHWGNCLFLEWFMKKFRNSFTTRARCSLPQLRFGSRLERLGEIFGPVS
jgi:hypothetical protein